MHTLILDKPCYGAHSLGVFLNNSHQSLASFAAGISKQTTILRPKYHRPYVLIRCGHSRQATLHPVFPGMQVFSSLSFAKPEPPWMWGHARMPLRIAPAPLTPSNDPRLGVASRYQKLHRCALDGFLGPSSKLAELTRILQPFAGSFSKSIISFLCLHYQAAV